MAVTFRNQTGNVATGTSATGTEPTGTIQNDLMVAIYAVATAGVAAGIPAGWTSIFNGSSASLFKYNLAYIVRGASAPSFAFTHTGSVYRELHIMTFTGNHPASPIDASTNGGNTAGINPDAPSVTAINAATLALAVAINWAGSNASAWGAPAGYTNRTRNAVNDDVIAASKSLVSAGAENPAAWTNGAGSAASENWTATITIKPFVAAPSRAVLQAVNRASSF